MADYRENSYKENADLQQEATRRWAETGTSGIEAWSGYIRMAYHSELRYPTCIPLFNRIWRNDPEVAVARLVQSSMASRLGVEFSIDPQVDDPTDDDKRAVDFANETLNDLEGGIGRWIESAMTRVPFYGWGWWEAVPGLRKQDWHPPGNDPWRSDYDDGLIGYRRLGFRHYESFYAWDLDDKSGRLRGFTQYDIPNPIVTIPLERSLHVVHGDPDSPEGLPVMEALWRLERIKYNFEVVMGIGFEHAAGHVSVTTDRQLTPDDHTEIKKMVRALLTAQEGNYAAWPRNVKGEVVDSPFAAAESLLNTIRYYGILKLALIAMQWAALGTLSPYGSYSSVKDANEFYLAVFNAMAESYVNQADAQIGRRLFDYPVNRDAFPDMTRRPKLGIRRVQKMIDLANLGAFIQAYAAIAPLGDDDLIEVRRKSDFLPEALPVIELEETSPVPETEPAPEEEGEESLDDEGTPEEPSTTLGWLRLAELEQNGGVMIAFYPQPEAAGKLAVGIDGALPADELHLTLAFLGPKADVKVKRSEVAKALAAFAASMPPVTGRVTGRAVFDLAGNGTGKAYVALVDSPDITGFRQRLVDALRWAGIAHSRTHGFIPHVTLAYATEIASLPPVEAGIDLEFGALHLVWGGKHETFKLSGVKRELAFRPFTVSPDERPTTVEYIANDPAGKVQTALNRFRRWAKEHDPGLLELLDAEVVEE